MAQYRIFVTREGEKRGQWLGMNGSTTRLLIHAVNFDDPTKAAKIAKDITDKNPGVAAEVRGAE